MLGQVLRATLKVKMLEGSLDFIISKWHSGVKALPSTLMNDETYYPNSNEVCTLSAYRLERRFEKRKLQFTNAFLREIKELKPSYDVLNPLP